ncbi:MAG TPA: lamin tail domain-containing protein, partial [Pyrinomonadaceae bacterium]|nr:lamin tail domain-containing protein [Pyrinomonadaceae bacterium]
MSRTKSPVTRSSKVALIVCLGFLLSLAVAFGATINRSAPQTALAGGRPASTIPRAANSSRVHKMAAPLLTTQPDAQFDITQNLIAGGGDASAAGQFGIDGNLGEPTAGTVMSGGNFKQAGGFEFATSTGPLPDATPGTPIVISEFRTRAVSGANDEFVELYNNTDAPIDLSGWVIKASNNAGAVSNRLTINAGTTIPARKHFLAVNSLGYSGVVTGDQAYPTGITDDGGIAIFDSANVLIDQVGMNPGSAFKEGTTLTPFNSGDTSDRSYERLPGGASGSTQDTDDNGADFVLVTPSSPQNLASLSTPSSGGQPSLVISQIYTDGGNSGATYTNDFIEIFNRGDATVDFSTTPYSVQYASATGAFSSNKTDLIIGTVAPGRYFLIQEGSNGSVGVPLPQPDVTGTINLSASAGKVSLVASLSTLPAVTCPGDDGISPFNPGLAGISDFVGYGAGTNCFEGSGVAAAPSAALATFRNSSGCADTNDNAADFAAAAANPRNSTIAVNTCSAAPSPTPTPTPTPTPANCVRVTVPAGLSAINNTLLSVPINVNDTTGKEIVSFDFKLNYDPSVLTPAVLPSQSDTLSGEFTITTNNATPGHLVVSGFGTQPLSGAGTLLKLNFNVIGAEPACSDLTLSPFTFNEGVPCATMIDGDVCVTKGTIAG